jgi:hypothetical protein
MRARRRKPLKSGNSGSRTVALSTTITPEMMAWIEEKVQEQAPYARKGGVVFQLLLESMAREKRGETEKNTNRRMT